jgi:hypothetical protein
LSVQGAVRALSAATEDLMAKKTSKRRSSQKSAAKTATRRRTARKEKQEEAAFVESLVAHGQAAKPRADGTLPPGATHEISEGKDGEVKVVRRRFSLL